MENHSGKVSFDVLKIIAADRSRDFVVELGQVDGIGASGLLLHVEGKNIMIEHGIAVDKKGEFQIQGVPFGNYLPGVNLDLVIATHAHLDHIGSLVGLLKTHPEACLLISRKAFGAAKILLEDSLKISSQEHRKGGPEPIFSANDLHNFLVSDMIELIDEPIWVEGNENIAGWEFGFYSSGHDVGAVSIFISSPNNKRFFITGDTASHDQETVKGVLLPPDEFTGDFFKKPGLIMVTEATNGAKCGRPRSETKFELKKALEKVRTREGVALIASFMKNRSANLMLTLVELGYSPWIDGSARKMIREEIPEIVEKLLKEGKVFFVDESDDHSKAYAQREALVEGRYGFHPIIAPSATLEKGFAVWYAMRILPGKNNAVIFPGYLFENSTSRQVYDIYESGIGLGRTINMERMYRGKIDKIPVNIHAEILHFDFSAHDYKEGLIARIKAINPAVLVVHHTQVYDSFKLAVEELTPKIQRIEHASHRHVIFL